MSLIRQFIDRIYPSSRTDTTSTILFFGLGNSGKTTLLYFLKLNEVVSTIPSLGITVETFGLPSSSSSSSSSSPSSSSFMTKSSTTKLGDNNIRLNGIISNLTSACAFGFEEKKDEIVGWDIGTGCGGIMMMKIAVNMYRDNGDAIVWVVDSTERDDQVVQVGNGNGNGGQENWDYGNEYGFGLSESVKEFKEVIGDNVWISSDGEKSSVDGNAKPIHRPILILAHKQDLPNATTINEIHKAFEKVLKGQQLWAVYPTTVMKGSGNESGLPQAFEWLKIAIEISRGQTSVDAKATTTSPASTGTGNEKSGRPEQVSLQLVTTVRSPGILSQRLESWLGRLEGDIGPERFLELFEAVDLPTWDHYVHIRVAFHMLKKYGRREGKDRVFSGIERYIARGQRSQTNGRTFHFTMTYFWIQIVHYGIQSVGEFPPESWVDEFARFLIVNPYVVDGQLWTDYYRKEVIMSQDAKATMVLPDKKPLPSVAVRDVIAKLKK